MIEDSNYIENEVIYIERTIYSMSYSNIVLFLIKRLYKNFEDDLLNAQTYEGVIDYSIDEGIRETSFLNKYGNEYIKSHILNQLGWDSHQGQDLGSNYFSSIIHQFNIYKLIDNSHTEPILVTNKDFLLFSPFIYSEKTLLELITYELSLIDKNDIKHYLVKIESTFKELSHRIGSHLVWDLINEPYRNYQDIIANEEDPFCYYDRYEDAKMFNISERKSYCIIKLSEKIRDLDIEEINRAAVLIKKRNKSIVKLKYNKSPLKLRDLLVHFFENKGEEIQENEVRKINTFLMNCVESKNKYSHIYNAGHESINFFTKKTFYPFVALIVYLIKKEAFEFSNPSELSKLFLYEFKTINQSYIGLSSALRDKISQELIPKRNEELLLIIDDKSINIDLFIKN
jgi:hypothetical protein